MTLSIICYYVSAEDFWIRTAFTQDNRKKARISCAVSTSIMFFIGIISAIIGANIKFYGNYEEIFDIYYKIPDVIIEIFKNAPIGEQTALALFIIGLNSTSTSRNSPFLMTVALTTSPGLRRP